MTQESSPVEPEGTQETRVEVGIVRSVRITRLLIVGTVLGALIMSLITLLIPLEDGADYTLGQAVGFMTLVGAVVGLLLGALLGLFLGIFARRKRGSGVAIQSDVQ